MNINGKKLRSLRENRGYTLRELAEHINEEYGAIVVSPATLSKWENNPDANPFPAKLAKVARFLGSDAAELTEKEVYNEAVEKIQTDTDCRDIKTENGFTILEWNINGRSGSHRAYCIPDMVCEELRKHQADVIVLTEFVAAAGWHHLRSSLERDYNVVTAPYVTGQNSILIGVKKSYPIIGFRVEMNPSENQQYPKPNFLQVDVEINQVKISLIGTRIRPENEYKEREKQAIVLLEHIKTIENPVLVIGDFNNAKEYGDLVYSFQEVKNEYVRAGEKLLTYDYNLHRLKDLFNREGFTMESEPQHSFVYKNGKIKDDHIFVRNMKLEKVEFLWDFVTRENGYYGVVPGENSLEQFRGYPDHAVLKAEVSLK